MAYCPFWSNEREKFKCYKECPMNEKITGEECVFSLYLDKSFLLEDDYEKSNLVLSQVN
ncbi:hypothetical protein GNF78_08530 [Clostridium perfringens]|uniref:hypothetical protein n=1 Tax=Clostridium perfringens TaxID=1502 RepID=UPI00285B1FE6|nr:hypothetical protein [Clostridium perfringens]EIL8446574.1 hypothetical protein [Clostridium perfringens]ELC8380871.1 hypothetical protein [Clostridium perfringens]MDM0491512.1 hypothetical protein [Clostridium perfringens]MDU7955253.1 hypothetical protein [Clostridium perfringens]MDZ5038249.1 hypothetical protein [Clostridium perfringens]